MKNFEISNMNNYKEVYKIQAADTAEVRHWITNHLDLSQKWIIETQ